MTDTSKMIIVRDKDSGEMNTVVKNRKSRLLGHFNFDGQNHRFVRKGNKNGFIYGFGHYVPDFGYYLGFASK